MKHIPILYIIIVGSLLHLLGGCSWTDSYPDTLLQAEQLMKVYQPDSALALLTRYKDTAMREDMRTRMYHHLLTTKALDKCHIPHTSDSLMYEVVKYYEIEGPANLLTEGYYLLGSVYEDMGIPTKALENYLKTWERIEDQDEYQFKGLVCSRIGTLYMFQALYDEALPFFRKAFQYDQLAGDSIGLVYDLRDLGRYYEVKKQKDSTLIYFNKARNMAQIIQEAKLEKIVAQEMAHTYLNCKDTNTVRLILEQVKNIESDNNPAFTYNLWADFYKVINKEDSMTYFYQKSLEVGNVHVKRKASEELYLIENKKQNYKEANRYMRLYVKQVDSLRKLTETESLSKMHALYNREKMEKVQNMLREENTRLRFEILIACIIILATSIIYYLSYKKKKLQQELLEKKSESTLNKHKQSSLQLAEENKQKILELKMQLEESRGKNDVLQQNMLNLEKDILERQNEMIQAQKAKREALMEQLKQSDVYHRLIMKAQVGDKATTDEFVELGQLIDSLFDNFTVRLYDLCPTINSVDMYMCYLIKIGISPMGIVSLQVRTPSAISMARKRLCKKIIGNSASISDLDELIRTF